MGYNGLVHRDLTVRVVAEEERYNPMVLYWSLQHKYALFQRVTLVDTNRNICLKNDSKVHVYLHNHVQRQLDSSLPPITDVVTIKVDIHHVFFLTTSLPSPYPCRYQYYHRKIRTLLTVR